MKIPKTKLKITTIIESVYSLLLPTSCKEEINKQNKIKNKKKYKHTQT